MVRAAIATTGIESAIQPRMRLIFMAQFCARQMALAEHCDERGWA